MSNLPKNALYSALSSVSNLILMALVVVAGRVLGDTDYGKFSFALAVASISEMAVDFGLNTLAVRSVSRDRALGPRYMASILPWKSLLSVVVMLALVPAAYLLTRAADTRIAILAMGLAIVLRSFKSTTHAFFRAHERFDLVLLTTYTERVSVLLICGAVLLMKASVVSFAFAFALARLPDLIYSFYLMHTKVERLRWRIDISSIREIQMRSLPLGSMNIVTVTYAYVGTVILGAFRPPAEVGWYSAAYRIYEGLSMFPFILITVLLPRLSYLFTGDRDSHRELVLRVFRYISLFAAPIALSLGMLSPQVIHLLYGREFARAVPILNVLLVASVFMFFNWTLNTVLVSADNERVGLRITATGLAIMCVANLVLVRLFGVIGSAAAVVVSEASVFLMLLLAVRRVVGGIPVHSISWRPVSACVLGVAAAAVLPRDIAIAGFAPVYLAAVVILGAFDVKDWAAIRSLFGARF